MENFSDLINSIPTAEAGAWSDDIFGWAIGIVVLVLGTLKRGRAALRAFFAALKDGNDEKPSS